MVGSYEGLVAILGGPMVTFLRCLLSRFPILKLAWSMCINR